MKIKNKLYFKLTSETFNGLVDDNEQIKINVIEALFGDDDIENIEKLNMIEISNGKDGTMTSNNSKYPTKVLVITENFLESYKSFLKRNAGKIENGLLAHNKTFDDFNFDDLLTVLKKTIGSTCYALKEEELGIKKEQTKPTTVTKPTNPTSL